MQIEPIFVLKPYVLWDRNIFPAENAVQGLLGLQLKRELYGNQGGVVKGKREPPRVTAKPRQSFETKKEFTSYSSPPILRESHLLFDLTYCLSIFSSSFLSP